MFDTLQDRLAATFKGLRSKGRLSDADIDATAREIRVALLEADVNLGVVKEFVAAIKERASGAELSGALNPAQQVIKIVNEELIAILGGETRLLRFAKRPPTVIMLAGLQGSGKTTLAGKLALWLRQQGYSPLLVAADLQRPNGQSAAGGGRESRHPRLRSGTGRHHGGQRTAGPLRWDPVAVARFGRRSRAPPVRHGDHRHGGPARHRRGDDAAGRRHPRRRAPDEVLFVVDAMIGQDAVNTANAFAEGVGFDGVVLTKLDGDARAARRCPSRGSPVARFSSPQMVRR